MSLCLIFLATFSLMAGDDSPLEDPNGQIIINRYLQATQIDARGVGKKSFLAVEIEASVPRLNEHGHLKALRKISEVGKITYRVLGFQGDNTVKSQVIARYLQAEQQGQNDKTLTLTPANYKFKLKGRKQADNSRSIYIFAVSPRKKRVGLFKGEMWLDSATYLPVLEKGRLVKNPSVFFRQVDFESEFAVLNGSNVPARMSSVIATRLVGVVNLSVAYSSPTAIDSDEEVTDGATANPRNQNNNQ